VKAFLYGYTNDELSRYFAHKLWQISQEFIECMEKAEKQSKPFQEIYWAEKLRIFECERSP
jgi:hypothetical protein